MTSGGARNRRGRRFSVERLAALSDGIFAIVLTLLVLELKVPNPPASPTDFWWVLGEKGEEAIGWVLSFVVVARLWLVHHDTLARIPHANRLTTLTNLAFLGVISLLPFGANLVGTYHFDGSEAILVFSAVLALSGLLLGAMTLAAEHHAGLRNKGARLGRGLTHTLIVLPAAAVAAGLLSMVSPHLSVLLLVIESIVGIVALHGDEDDVESVAEVSTEV